MCLEYHYSLSDHPKLVYYEEFKATYHHVEETWPKAMVDIKPQDACMNMDSGSPRTLIIMPNC